MASAAGQLELLHEMRADGLAPGCSSFNALLNAHGAAKVGEVLVEMRRLNVAPDATTAAAAIAAFGREGQVEDGLELVREFYAFSRAPQDARVFDLAIAALNEAGRWEEAWRLFRRMPSAGVRPTAATFTEMARD